MTKRRSSSSRHDDDLIFVKVFSPVSKSNLIKPKMCVVHETFVIFIVELLLFGKE